MRFSFFTVIIGLLIQLTSCNDDFENTVLSTGDLSFSSDTVYLDTIFTNISSSTRTLKVYNRSNANVTIPNIKLARGEGSFYRLNVDGIDGKSFYDIDILANDSIYVFIEATIDFNEVTNPIYTDSIVFDEGSNMQDVDLVTLVQDAHFLYPAKNSQGVKEKIVLGSTDEGLEITVDGFYLDKNTIWKNDKPYVIYGYAGVPEDGSLIIEKGVRVYFHNDSGLLVEKNATLKVNGEIGEEVSFEGDRLEPFYENIAGQWGTIWLRSDSKDHEINNAIIKNSTIGLLVERGSFSTIPTLTILDSQIYNTSSFGLLGRNTIIKGENVVVGNNAMSSLACTLGGSYSFIHSTFANYWNEGIRLYPTLLLNNYDDSEPGSGDGYNLISANFTNCIIDGNHNIELILDKNNTSEFNYNFKNCMIKFDDSNGNYLNDPLYDFNNTDHYQNIVLNGKADFKNIENNEYLIGIESDAIDSADENAALMVPFDLLKTSRIQNPDIGAYQHISFSNE